jgi:hypothetical protein
MATDALQQAEDPAMVELKARIKEVGARAACAACGAR